MDSLLKAALPGTGKHPAPPLDPEHPVDRLIAPLATDRPEWNLLLRAGAWSVYETAGRVPQELSDAPSPAPPETRAACSRRAAVILLSARDDEDLLLECLGRLDRAGQRLPFDVLPTFLDQRCEPVREVLRLVLGERGRWLVQFNGDFNGDWRWALTPSLAAASAAETVPADAETLWQEGTPEQRRSVLRLVRTVDPAKARQWLQTAWPQEKADTRAAFLEGFEAGLSPADEEFLETCLDDRSKKVQAAAASLLSRLPGSKLARRMRERAEGMLSYAPAKPSGKLKAALKALTGGSGSNALTVTPPQDLDKDWQRDGVQEKPPQGTGKRAFWLAQVMALVPPSHWESRFQGAPADLIRAAEADEFGPSLVEAWSHGAARFRLPSWLAACWDYWLAEAVRKKKAEKPQALAMLVELLPAMEPAQAEEHVAQLLGRLGGDLPIPYRDLLAGLPRPWSKPLGRAYLDALRRFHAEHLSGRGRQDGWQVMSTLPIASRALPEACFEEATGPWEFPETTDYQHQYWRTELGKFVELIRTRRDFAREVPVTP